MAPRINRNLKAEWDDIDFDNRSPIRRRSPRKAPVTRKEPVQVNKTVHSNIRSTASPRRTRNAISPPVTYSQEKTGITQDTIVVSSPRHPFKSNHPSIDAHPKQQSPMSSYQRNDTPLSASLRSSKRTVRTNVAIQVDESSESNKDETCNESDVESSWSENQRSDPHESGDEAIEEESPQTGADLPQDSDDEGFRKVQEERRRKYMRERRAKPSHHAHDEIDDSTSLHADADLLGAGGSTEVVDGLTSQSLSDTPDARKRFPDRLVDSTSQVQSYPSSTRYNQDNSIVQSITQAQRSVHNVLQGPIPASSSTEESQNSNKHLSSYVQVGKTPSSPVVDGTHQDPIPISQDVPTAFPSSIERPTQAKSTRATPLPDVSQRSTQFYEKRSPKKRSAIEIPHDSTIEYTSPKRSQRVHVPDSPHGEVIQPPHSVQPLPQSNLSAQDQTTRLLSRSPQSGITASANNTAASLPNTPRTGLPSVLGFQRASQTMQNTPIVPSRFHTANRPLQQLDLPLDYELTQKASSQPVPERPRIRQQTYQHKRLEPPTTLSIEELPTEENEAEEEKSLMIEIKEAESRAFEARRKLETLQRRRSGLISPHNIDDSTAQTDMPEAVHNHDPGKMEQTHINPHATSVPINSVLKSEEADEGMLDATQPPPQSQPNFDAKAIFNMMALDPNEYKYAIKADPVYAGLRQLFCDFMTRYQTYLGPPQHFLSVIAFLLEANDTIEQDFVDDFIIQHRLVNGLQGKEKSWKIASIAAWCEEYMAGEIVRTGDSVLTIDRITRIMLGQEPWREEVAIRRIPNLWARKETVSRVAPSHA